MTTNGSCSQTWISYPPRWRESYLIAFIPILFCSYSAKARRASAPSFDAVLLGDTDSESRPVTASYFKTIIPALEKANSIDWDSDSEAKAGSDLGRRVPWAEDTHM